MTDGGAELLGRLLIYLGTTLQHIVNGSRSRLESATRYPLKRSGSTLAELRVKLRIASETTSSSSESTHGTPRTLEEKLIQSEKSCRMTGSSATCMGMSGSGCETGSEATRAGLRAIRMVPSQAPTVLSVAVAGFTTLTAAARHLGLSTSPALAAAT